jgi:hypothetical protein
MAGCDTVQVVKYWPFTAQPQVHCRVTSCDICGGRNGIGAGFYLSFFGFPMQIVPSPLFHIHVTAP